MFSVCSLLLRLVVADVVEVEGFGMQRLGVCEGLGVAQRLQVQRLGMEPPVTRLFFVGRSVSVVRSRV